MDRSDLRALVAGAAMLVMIALPASASARARALVIHLPRGLAMAVVRAADLTVAAIGSTMAMQLPSRASPR
jgi:hypothetical protein